MSVTADMVRDLIVGHDRARPRSKQTAIGPSDLSSPCSRKLMYQLLGVDKTRPDSVNLAAWVGTQIHHGMEAAAKGHDDWETEIPLGIKIGPGVKLTGTADAYHKPTYTLLDYKSCGPSALAKYRRHMPDNYETQIDIYGLMAILSARFRVDNVGIALIPRNGDLSDIHVMTRPWNSERADAALKRLTDLHTASAAGPVVLPLVGTADDCRYCGWWNPDAWAGADGCPGHTDPGDTAEETQPNTQKETAQ